MSAANLQTRRYLIRQLGRNPWEAAEQIIASRARALGQQPEARPRSEVDPAEQRRAAREALDAVRAECFTGDVAALAARLDALPLADLPDLRAAADRLRVILASRKDLPPLTQQPGFDGDFFECFKEILVKPARETAVLRERVVASMQQRKLRKRAKSTVRLLASDAPQLYALEPDWLASLADTKSRHYFADMGPITSIVVGVLAVPTVVLAALLICWICI